MVTGRGGVPNKEFDRICTMMQITMTAGEHEALAALNMVNRILEKQGLRWDDWLKSLKVVERVKENNGAGDSSYNTYKGQSTWNYNPYREYDKAKRRKEQAGPKYQWEKHKHKENPNAIHKVPPPTYQFVNDTDKEFLEKEGVEWVQNIYNAATAFGGLHSRSMEFLKDYWETRVRRDGRDCMISKKQYDWLVNIQERLERMGAYR